MTRTSLVLIPVILLFAACQPDSTRSPQRIRTSVDSLLDEYRTSMTSGTVDDLMSVYSSDERFHWVEDGEVVYESAEEIRRALKGLRTQYPQATLDLSNTSITPLPPDHALITTQFEQSLADSTGEGFSFSGAMTITAVEEADGWRFLAGHTSSPRGQ